MDAVRLSFYRRGFLAARQVPMTASDEEHVVVLNPDQVASGTVTDASTGKPIPRFRAIRGIVFSGDQTAWQRGQSAE